MQKITVIKQDDDPRVLVITPLLPGHNVSQKTKTTLKRNKTPLVWLSSQGNGNIPTNAQYGIDWYKNIKTPPEYYIMIDNDIEMGRGMIDKLVRKLEYQPDHVAFAYASFEFVGLINRKFPAIPYDIDRLMQHNYISSQSLIRTKCLKKIGGLVCDDKYIRLLDWCLWLKFFYHDYIGINCPNASFIAHSTEGNISTRSDHDYFQKRTLVIEDFVKPIMEKYQK